MTQLEAEKIFNIWKNYYWPFHTLLHSVFISSIPRSFLPYPEDTLEEALNIIAKSYHDTGNFKAAKDIQESIASLISYTNDEDAFAVAANGYSDTQMNDLRLFLIQKFKNDWVEWIENK